jgi:hypothetical protein
VEVLIYHFEPWPLPRPSQFAMFSCFIPSNGFGGGWQSAASMTCCPAGLTLPAPTKQTCKNGLVRTATPGAKIGDALGVCRHSALCHSEMGESQRPPAVRRPRMDQSQGGQGGILHTKFRAKDIDEVFKFTMQLDSGCRPCKP